MRNPDPASQHKHLFRHFFGRFFDIEAISSPQVDSIEKNALIIQFLAMMVLPGVLYCLLILNKYAHLVYRPAIERDLASLTDKCILLSLSMIIIGFLTVFEWETLFPDRRDYEILTPLPVSTRSIFLSKGAALAAFLLAFTAAIDLCPTFLFPTAVLDNNSFAYRFLGKTVPLSQVIQYIISHAMSMLLANIFIFFSAISLQGIILALTPQRLAPTVSRCVRLFCLVLLFGCLFCLPAISSVDQLIYTANPITAYFPPVWFVGIYEIMLGSHEGVMWGLAGRAVSALMTAGALSILTYAMCYRRFMRRSIESGPGIFQQHAAIRRAGNFILDNWLLRKSLNRAAYHFVAQTVFRSPRHALHIGTYLAVGVSIAGIGLAGQFLVGNMDRAILSVPLILSFFLLVGMRAIFAIPVDLESNWLFRLAPIQQAESVFAGARKFLVFAIIVPVYVFAALFYRLFWSWDVAGLHVCFGVTLSLLLMQVLFYRFPKIPFTCSYLPSAARSIFLYPFYFFGFASFAFATAHLEVWLARDPHRFLYFFGYVAVLFILLLRQTVNPVLKVLGEYEFGNEEKIRFEEHSRVAPVYLDLRN